MSINNKLFETISLLERENKGIIYEGTVRAAIQEALQYLPNVELLPDIGGGSNRHVVDIYMLINNEKFGFEVKENMNARMGTSSLSYDLDSKEFTKYSKEGDSDFDEYKDFILGELYGRGIEDAISDALDYMNSLSKHYRLDGLSGTVEKSVWEKMQKAGLLLPTTTFITADSSYILNHYAKKGAYYMQVGAKGKKGSSMGLVYLKDNPLDLPVPQLQAELKVECRLGRGGSRMNVSTGLRTVSMNYYLFPKIQASPKSPYSLDRVDDIIELFGNL